MKQKFEKVKNAKEAAENEMESMIDNDENNEENDENDLEEFEARRWIACLVCIHSFHLEYYNYAVVRMTGVDGNLTASCPNCRGAGSLVARFRHIPPNMPINQPRASPTPRATAEPGTVLPWWL